MNMSVNELYDVAIDFLGKEYNLKLTIPIVINPRMSTHFGFFKFKGRKPYRIDLSESLVSYHTKDEIIDVLKHELVHYACFINKKPFNDGDTFFKNELDRLGVGRTGTMKFKGRIQVYKCSGCGKRVEKRMKGYDKKYICGTCKNEFVYVGESIMK